MIRWNNDGGDSNQAFLSNFESNIEDSLDTFDSIRELLSTFDLALVNKLKLHENDFLSAYQLHMVKIEKELQLLKAKSEE